MSGNAFGGWAIAKFFPGLLGLLGGLIGFLFMFPKTPKEGFSRLLVAGICSHFFGDSFLHVIVRFGGEWVVADQIRSGCYLFVGGVGFFVVGAGFRWFEKRHGKDIQELVQDAKK